MSIRPGEKWRNKMQQSAINRMELKNKKEKMYQNEDINIIRDTILKEINPYQILLLGSYATGKQTEESDIDLMILVKEEISRKEKLNILFKIEKRFLKLKYDIDIILKNWAEFNKYKKYIGTVNYDVSRECKILWTKN